MLRSAEPSPTASATHRVIGSRTAFIAVALVAVLALLPAVPAAQAAPVVDSSTAATSPERGWTVFDLDWWKQAVQVLLAGSGTETDEGAGSDSHGIDSAPADPVTSTSTDDWTPDGEEGEADPGLDPNG